jgi:sn-glycerol 3-phosphate transport system ATP-binding protein/multiple sugar transport system ATP-binding protein
VATSNAPLRCRTRALEKRFGETAILRGMEVQIHEGEFAVLVGPSGCGKSTLLRTVAGLEQPDAGKVYIADKDVTHLPPRERDIAMVFQNYALYPHLSVRENLAFGLKLRREAPGVIAERIRDTSEMLGIAHLLERLPKELSGGQRQRVAMGRALVRRAALYLFDEPLSNLDAELRAEVRVQIRKLHDQVGATTLYVTHDQVEAMTLADTLFVLNRGVVEQFGAPLDVYEQPDTKFVASFLGSPRMNFILADALRTSTEGYAEVRARGLTATLSLTAQLPATDLELGVRPQDCAVCSAPEAMGTLRVTLVETLGSEGLAHGVLVDAGNGSAEVTPFLLRLDAREMRSVRQGDQVPFRAHRVHAFHRETGRCLR